MMEDITALVSRGQISAPLLFLVAAALAAGLARGFSGFGAALIFIPLASALVGPQLAVPLLPVVDGFTTIGMIPKAFKSADRREVATMALGAVAGIPMGIYCLAILDPDTIRWAITGVVVLLLTLLISGWRYDGQPKAPLTIVVGLVAGLFSGVAQIGGPPVIAYWLGGAIPAAAVRANIILLFAVTTVISLAGYLIGGLITMKIVWLAVLVAPFYGVGVWLGSRMFGLASERTFRMTCYVMIAAAALLGMPLLDGLLRKG